jgi:hypothetical protein
MIITNKEQRGAAAAGAGASAPFISYSSKKKLSS